MDKITLKLNPEFGCELVLAIPYVYWLHQQDKLEGVITSVGMKPFYYFCDNVDEKFTSRTIDNTVSGLNQLPNKWMHHNSTILNKEYGKLTDEEKSFVHGNLDYTQWTPPPYVEVYGKDIFNFNKRYVVVSNRYNLEHGNQPVGYFDIPFLYKIFNHLIENDYIVIYKRPKNVEFPTDNNELQNMVIKADVEDIGEITDFDLVGYYDNVILLDDLVKENKNMTYNEVQLHLFSNASGFISMAGGSGIFCSYFGKPNITYVTTSGELREGYFDENSYYRKLSNAPIYAFIDNENDIKARGHRDYSELYKKVKEVFK
jgi:hypothetical protein